MVGNLFSLVFFMSCFMLMHKTRQFDFINLVENVIWPLERVSFLTFRVLTHSTIHSFIQKKVIAVILLVYRYVTSHVLTRSSKDPFQVVQEARPFFIGHTGEWIIRVCVFQFHHQLSQRTVLWELLELKTVFQISLKKWMRSAAGI